MFKYINRVFIQVHRFTLELEYDIFTSFSITVTSYIDTIKLGRVIVIIISLKLLVYQEQPIFKTGFFLSIHNRWSEILANLLDPS